MNRYKVISFVVVVILIVYIISIFSFSHPLETAVPGVATTTIPIESQRYNTYTNNKYKFTIEYPDNFSIVPKETASNTASNLDNLDTTDILIAEFPRDNFKGTNLASVQFVAGAKKVTENICKDIVNGNSVSNYPEATSEDVKIKDIIFNKVRVVEGAAGNFYETIRYSTYENGVCYELIGLAHSNDINIIKETNPNAVQYSDDLFVPDLKKVVSFFKFDK